MNYRPGDKVVLTKGENRIVLTIVDRLENCVPIVTGKAWQRDIEAYVGLGWSVESVVRKTELPTEPGIYADRLGMPWVLDDFDARNGIDPENLWMSPYDRAEWVSAKRASEYAPFRRLRVEGEEAAEVIKEIRKGIQHADVCQFSGGETRFHLREIVDEVRARFLGDGIAQQPEPLNRAKTAAQQRAKHKRAAYREIIDWMDAETIRNYSTFDSLFASARARFLPEVKG